MKTGRTDKRKFRPYRSYVFRVLALGGTLADGLDFQPGCPFPDGLPGFGGWGGRRQRGEQFDGIPEPLAVVMDVGSQRQGRGAVAHERLDGLDVGPGLNEQGPVGVAQGVKIQGPVPIGFDRF